MGGKKKKKGPPLVRGKKTNAQKKLPSPNNGTANALEVKPKVVNKALKVQTAAAAAAATSPGEKELLPSRPRRSMVNYARDIGLRDSWDTPSSRGSGEQQMEAAAVQTNGEAQSSSSSEEAEEVAKVKHESSVTETEAVVEKNEQQHSDTPKKKTPRVTTGPVVIVQSEVNAPDEIVNIPALEIEQNQANSDESSDISASPRKRERNYKSLEMLQVLVKWDLLPDPLIGEVSTISAPNLLIFPSMWWMLKRIKLQSHSSSAQILNQVKSQPLKIMEPPPGRHKSSQQR